MTLYFRLVMFVEQRLSFFLVATKMQCSKETIVRLFYNASSSFQLLFLFFYLTSIFLSKLLLFISAIPFLPRGEEEYEYATFSEEEVEEEEEEEEVNDGYYYNENLEKDSEDVSCENSVVFDEEILPESIRSIARSDDDVDLSFYSFSTSESESEEIYHRDKEQEQKQKQKQKQEQEQVDEKKLLAKSQVNTAAITTRATSACTSFRYVGDEPSLRVTKKIAFVLDHDKIEERYRESGNKIESDLKQINNLPPLTRKLELEQKNKEDIFGDTNTVGSTSKSSSEWRSSINCQDPSYDPFSSSSRRSCPKWESYTVFQKYDEEMLFLDRISAQKLQETESFRSSTTCRSSISEKIIQKLASRKRKTSYIYQNSYHELEAAYVAQICLTWEALNWNYNYFHELRASSRRESDPGCPAYIAQQFQQFQVLLQRYIENEPYENGRRPVVYAKMRSLAPKLLQVPEYRDSDDEKKDEYLGSRISSESFQVIMEEAIKTFMNFLKADKENHLQIFSHLFRVKNPRSLVDPTALRFLKKLNHKKKLKLKDLKRSRKCLRKRRPKLANEMEVLMAQIDIKVVSRVLRTTDLSVEQVHWCEDKMKKVKVCDGKLQRDSSPLFFPAH